MLKNDIEKTLQAHKPEPSEGFAEMIDDKVLHLMAERQEQKAARKKKRIRLVPVTAAALVVVMCVGMLAANGHFGLINRPDEIRPGEGKYTVQPIETVLAQGTVPVPGETDGTENPPVLVEENESDVIDRGYSFIQHWNGESIWDDADLEAMLDLCTPEWKEKAGDTIEALKEILGNTSYNGMQGYISLSGESGDPVRTMTMQGHGKWVQTKLSFDLKLEADGLRYIDPESIQITVPEAEKHSLIDMKLEDLDADLEQHWPGITEELIPMNLSCESQGFRVEVISGLVKEREAWIVYSVQDLEEDREFDRDVYGYSFRAQTDIGHDMEELGGLTLGYDKEERREFLVAHQQFDEPIVSKNRNITLNVKDIIIIGTRRTELVPLIEQYGETVEGIEPPELHPAGRTDRDQNVLDYRNPLDIEIEEGVYLTGIGWIDDELHIQVRYTQTYKEGMFPLLTMYNSYPWGAEDYDAKFSGSVWTEDSGQGENWQMEVWREYYSPLKPEDVEYVRPALQVDTNLETVEGDWNIQIPLNQIMAGGSQDAAEPDGTDNPEETEAASGVESADINALLEQEWPGITNEMIPLNLSCEKQGFKVEVVSALVKGQEFWMVYSVEDLEGDRLSEEKTGEQISIFDSGLTIDCRGYYADHKNDWYYDETNHRVMGVVYHKYTEQILPTNTPVKFNIHKLGIMEYTFTDLTSLIEQYGKTAEGTKPPEVLFTEGGDQKLKVLDYHNPLDIPIDEGVTLTGIGVIDDELHIQVHFTDNKGMYDIPAVSAGVGYFFKDREYDKLNQFMTESWDENGDDIPDWAEFISRLKQDQTDGAETKLFIYRIPAVWEDDWEIQFPLSSIRKEGNQLEKNGLVYSLEEDDTIMVVSDPSYKELEEITVMESLNGGPYVRKIGESAFEDCVNLKSAKITKYVTEIEDHAFKGCENLVSVDLWRNRVSGEQNRYTDCTGVVSIGKGAFEGCKALTSIDLPENVMTIGGSAFRGCSSLASITIPDGAVFEGGYVFADCESLVSVTLPLRMENLEDYMFSGCENLEMVFIQNGTRTIGRGAFRNCGKLKLVEIPNSVYYITDYAFEGCGSLKKIEIPENVNYIGKNAFTGCENLVCVVYEGSYAQQYCEENGIQYEIRQAE